MSAQLGLFTPPRGEDTWVTGDVVDRSGLAAYVHMIRAPDDPERSPRKARSGKTSAWRDLAKRPLETFREEILTHLADGQPRTFNRICVELWDQTADMSGRADDALWALVHDGLLEHTLARPVLFRRRPA